MQIKRIAEKISAARQNKKMTQDELALRLGVTGQAVSKWERAIGMPDISLLSDICNILEIDGNDLLGLDIKSSYEKGFDGEANILLESCAEPILITIGEKLIPVFTEGLKTYLIYEKRLELAKSRGYIVPIIRIRDELSMPENEYAIYIYGKKEYGKALDNIDENTYEKIVDELFNMDKKIYAKILNKQIIKSMVDACEKNYQGITFEVFPDKISYLEIELIIKEILKKEGDIKNQIGILEEIEHQILIVGNRDYSKIADEIIRVLNK